MKILWATNTPSLAEKKINKEFNRGGWIKSLQYELAKTPKIKLGIVFLGDKDDSFELGNCNYYSLKRKSSNKFKRLLARKLHRVEEDLNLDNFKNIIESFNPDIIHIHGTENEFGLIQSLTDIPVVISIQGNLTVYSYKYYSGITNEEIRKYAGIKNNFLGLDLNNIGILFRKKTHYEKEILKNAKHVIGRTDWDRRITKVLSPNAEYYHNDEILRVEFYKKIWRSKNMGILKIHTTTGIQNYKGLETIIDTAILLQNHNLKFEWNVAGINNDTSIARICKKSRNINFIDISVKLLGELNETDLIEEMLKSNLFVQVSHIENSSNSLCEAMILGMPIIATNVGGTATLLTDKIDGILVQDGDPYSMSGAILESKEINNSFINYAKAARKKALKRHNPSKILIDLLDIYKSIILNK